MNFLITFLHQIFGHVNFRQSLAGNKPLFFPFELKLYQSKQLVNISTLIVPFQPLHWSHVTPCWLLCQFCAAVTSCSFSICMQAFLAFCLPLLLCPYFSFPFSLPYASDFGSFLFLCEVPGAEWRPAKSVHPHLWHLALLMVERGIQTLCASHWSLLLLQDGVDLGTPQWTSVSGTQKAP